MLDKEIPDVTPEEKSPNMPVYRFQRENDAKIKKEDPKSTCGEDDIVHHKTSDQQRSLNDSNPTPNRVLNKSGVQDNNGNEDKGKDHDAKQEHLRTGQEKESNELNQKVEKRKKKENNSPNHQEDFQGSNSLAALNVVGVFKNKNEDKRRGRKWSNWNMDDVRFKRKKQVFDDVTYPK